MAIINWNESYSVGVAKIDEQHKQLVSLLNSIFESMKMGKGNDAVSGILKQLINYTQYHFATEEELLLRTQYPEYQSHKLKHNELINQVNSLIAQYRQNTSGGAVKLTNFLKEWLIKHIQGTDKRYSLHLTRKGIH